MNYIKKLNKKLAFSTHYLSYLTKNEKTHLKIKLLGDMVLTINLT